MDCKITLDVQECIGCGACVALSDKYFEISTKDFKSHLKGAEKKDNEEIKISSEQVEKMVELAESCPVNCIHVFEGTNKRI